MVLRVVDENRDLLGADSLGSVAKHEQHGVDDIGLPTAIRAHN